ncbi:hypothetical protein RJT34_02679 [Clitoria ternatea]|uniref:Uncharacterized protein n=1 Tax=Clitoria ternatea TaxID=43366 RepID=A0AAN9KKP2_CLITE
MHKNKALQQEQDCIIGSGIFSMSSQYEVTFHIFFFTNMTSNARFQSIHFHILVNQKLQMLNGNTHL